MPSSRRWDLHENPQRANPNGVSMQRTRATARKTIRISLLSAYQPYLESLSSIFQQISMQSAQSPTEPAASRSCSYADAG